MRVKYKAMDLLRNLFNCKIVVRSAGSKGLVDVVGVNDNETFLVQVKSEKELPKKWYSMLYWSKVCESVKEKLEMSYLDDEYLDDEYDEMEMEKKIMEVSIKWVNIFVKGYKDFYQLVSTIKPVDTNHYFRVSSLFPTLIVFDKKRRWISIVKVMYMPSCSEDLLDGAWHYIPVSVVKYDYSQVFPKEATQK